MKLPNLLSLSRIALAPVFLLMFLSEAHGGFGDRPFGIWAALGIVIWFEVSDMADGFIARRFEQTSQLGKILDPLSDSISRFTVFLGFLVEGYASPFAIACIFYRDSIVSTLRVLAASKGVIVSARWSGKLKAVVQGAAIITLISFACAPHNFGFGEGAEGLANLKRDVAWPVMWGVAAMTLFSLCDYLWGNRKILASLDR